MKRTTILFLICLLFSVLLVSCFITPEEAVVVKFTVKYNANGGVGAMADQEFMGGRINRLAKNSFTCAGKVFVGWSETPDGEKKYDDESIITFTTDTVLYAVWEDELVGSWKFESDGFTLEYVLGSDGVFTRSQTGEESFSETYYKEGQYIVFNMPIGVYEPDCPTEDDAEYVFFKEIEEKQYMIINDYLPSDSDILAYYSDKSITVDGAETTIEFDVDAYHIVLIYDFDTESKTMTRTELTWAFEENGGTRVFRAAYGDVVSFKCKQPTGEEPWDFKVYEDTIKERLMISYYSVFKTEDSYNLALYMPMRIVLEKTTD